MGQALADAVGFPEPPMEVADSARAVLSLVGNQDGISLSLYASLG